MNRIPPSFRLFSGSKRLSSISSTRSPNPVHSGHIPAGWLKEYAMDPPALGLPTRENRSLNSGATSTAVPTVDRTLAPIAR